MFEKLNWVLNITYLLRNSEIGSVRKRVLIHLNIIEAQVEKKGMQNGD